MGREQIYTNVLIVGKSGAGKSSLLNYLFGCKHQETGAGKPITPKGLYDFDYNYDDELRIRIYDTWGLEANKSKEWKQLIMDEIRKHDKGAVSEWFNTIIYCLNGNAQLVEEFEIDYMKEILKENNHITVAITQCKEGHGEMVDHRMTKRLMKEVGISEDKIIYVNSVCEATIGGREEPQFGKEKIFCAILQNLWESLRTKVPHILKQRVEENISQIDCSLKDYVNNQRFLFQKDKKLNEIAESINSEFKRKICEIGNEMNRNFIDAVEYYNRLSKKYASIILVEPGNVEKRVGEYSLEEEFKDEVRQVLNMLASDRDAIGKLAKKINDNKEIREYITSFAVAVKKYVSSSKRLKEDLGDLIDQQANHIRTVMLQELEGIEKQLSKINVEEMYLHHVNAQKNIGL